MGSCLSSFSTNAHYETEQSPPTAKVVSINGLLHEYGIPISVSQVLEAEASSSSSSSSSSWFLCNSDLLSYDDYIPALTSNASLHPNHIYFVLPNSKLQNVLTASDMAALAVKAGSALQKASNNNYNRRKKARISPVLSLNSNSDSFEDQTSDEVNNIIVNVQTLGKSNLKKPQQQVTLGVSRSSSVRRLQKYTSRQAKLAARSFRLRLSIIYEGSMVI
ncbi:hypothetical protein K2173_017904 [Erythroxylum novogranatense]|uniref:Uncharacterized protein n=1 Tax=Erythroxylum novogranatense TaxID=1862640 RepID=A0AAV8S6I1_9ROSI|nr:hypothetical protein K2173_017904 [Erythroxylum novogranatense]